MKSIFRQVLMVATLGLVIFTIACNDDEELPQVVAGFTSSVNQETGVVTFTNISENATEYSWDFGDGTTSTEENPTKTYTEDGTYDVVLTAINGQVSDTFSESITIALIVIDDEAPVITLVGEATIEVEIADSYVDPGATATDNVDGDLTADIVVGGDDVNVFQPGTYEITYNVSDDAGNAATEVTRTVIVTYDDGLLINGDFQGATYEPWFTNYGDNTPEIREEGGNKYFFLNNQDSDPNQTFILNLSQVVEIGIGNTYLLSFNASTGAGTTRTIEAGIGLNEGDFRANFEVITLTENIQRFELELTAANFGSANSRVLFNMFGDVGVVVIDNVSLEIVSEYTVGLPLDFETEDAIVSPFNGTSFSFAADPANSSNQVGKITNAGNQWEGITISLGTPIDFSSDKVISMQFNTSTIDVPVLLKLEGGTEADTELTATATTTGWQELSFNFSSATGSYSKITIFVDGPGNTAGDFYIDDIAQTTAP